MPFWNLKMTLLDIKIKAFIVTQVLLLCHNYVCNISIKICYGAVNEFFDERKQKILKFRDNLSLKIKMLICKFCRMHLVVCFVLPFCSRHVTLKWLFPQLCTCWLVIAVLLVLVVQTNYAFKCKYLVVIKHLLCLVVRVVY